MSPPFRHQPGMNKVASLALIALSMAGCAGGLHSDAPPTQTYILRSTAAAARAADASGSAVSRAVEMPRASDGTPAAPSVQLPRPSADPGLATELITLVRSDRRMDYYIGSRWAANLPDLVETLAIDTLRASGAWAAVHESPSPFAAEYLLQIDIRRFEADYTGGGAAPRVFVVLDCTVARRIGRELVTSFVAEGVADASENKLSAVVAAFEEAANAALTTMADRSAAAARSGPSVAAAP
jgi:cholesterol transport system auxiliary component